MSNVYQERHFLIKQSGSTELNPSLKLFTRGACATWLGRSQLAILGGRDGSRGLKNINIYDLTKESWTAGKDLNAQRYESCCTTLTLNNGSRLVVIVGGKTSYYALGKHCFRFHNGSLWVDSMDGERRNASSSTFMP